MKQEKIYYNINNERVNFYSSGKLIMSKKIKWWYDENGNYSDNTEYILALVKKEFSAELIKSEMKIKNIIKKEYYCYPITQQKSRIQELREYFDLLRKFANKEFKNRTKKKFIDYMKWWVINYYYRKEIKYSFGWDHFNETSVNYQIALEGALKPISLLPQFVKKMIKKYKISPNEYHHIRVGEKVKDEGFYSPEDIISILKNQFNETKK